MNSFGLFISDIHVMQSFLGKYKLNASLFLRILNIKGASSEIRAAVRMIAEKLQEVGYIYKLLKMTMDRWFVA